MSTPSDIHAAYDTIYGAMDALHSGYNATFTAHQQTDAAILEHQRKQKRPVLEAWYQAIPPFVSEEAMALINQGISEMHEPDDIQHASREEVLQATNSVVVVCLPMLAIYNALLVRNEALQKVLQAYDGFF